MFAANHRTALDCNVLVLNKHYMAIRVVGAKRAFSLLFRQLAEVVSLEQGSYANYNFENWCEASEFSAVSSRTATTGFPPSISILPYHGLFACYFTTACRETR